MPTGVAATMASQISFSFFTMILMLDSFILKWQTIAAAELNLWYISSNSPYSYNSMTFLCFLGAFPASLEALRIGPMVLFKAYGIALNTMKNMSTTRDHFLLQYATYWRDRLLRDDWHSHCILSRSTLELTAVATGGGYAILH